MKKFKIMLLIVLLAVWVLFGMFFYVIFQFLSGGPGLIMPDENKADKLLIERYETLLPVAEAMLDIDGYYIRWDTFDENLAKNLSILRRNEDGESLSIDESIKKYGIDKYEDKIRKYKIWYIVKYDNHVSFTLWSSFTSSCSLVYCEEGIPGIEQDGENYVVPLSIEKWYYHTNICDR